VDSSLVEPPAQLRGVVGGPAVRPGENRGRGTPLLVYAENAVPERAGGYGSYPVGFVLRQRERPVDGASDKVHEPVGIHLSSIARGGLEAVKKLDLGVVDVPTHPIVEGGPHRGRSHVYSQDQLVFHTALPLILPNAEHQS
jgi:hypothetical protein